MLQVKTVIIVLITLIVGFTGGFILRPVIMPTANTMAASPPPAPAVARGTQYFAANLDDARRIVAGCRDGSVRGNECINAQQAVAEADGLARLKKFMGH